MLMPMSVSFESLTSETGWVSLLSFTGSVNLLSFGGASFIALKPGDCLKGLKLESLLSSLLSFRGEKNGKT
jgi:hypothetical protein